MSSQLMADLHFEISFPGRDGLIQRRTYLNPSKLLIASRLDEVADVIRAAGAAAGSGLTAVGFVSYEAAAAFDPKLTTRDLSDFPLALFALFEGSKPDNAKTSATTHDVSWELDTPYSDYADNIDAIRKAIQRGDTYQVNYTVRSKAIVHDDGLALYRRFTEAQNARYCAYLRFGKWQILSVSPELFFEWDGRRIETRPVKGTAARDLAEPDDGGQGLLESDKDRAENVMIVDLLRNDLGRIAEFGSVSVDELLALEAYPTFYQLASQISAVTRSDISLLDVFSALFPCGSVTGAPKRSTMTEIAKLESSPRGVYCGAIGFVEPADIGPSGASARAVFSVPIRTTTINTQTHEAITGLGSGVTWDSRAEDEFAEIAVKGRYLNAIGEDWSLLETIRLEDGTYWLLEGHMDRLRESAEFFKISWTEPAVRKGLANLAEEYANGSWRVRLLVDRDGGFRTEIYELNDLPESLTFGLSTNPVSSTDVWLQNKTTRRSVYEDRLKEFDKAFDVLLVNERGELTEFTRGNLVLRIGDEHVTPSVASGLLNGTLRRDLIRSGSVVERVLVAEDLIKAQEVWFINSVRGWVKVVVIPG